MITPSKTTTKVRIVYDSSAKTKKEAKSLNKCLLRGPVILEDLCGLLLRFRLEKIALLADLEKAFLQVGLQPSEREVARFLWLKDISKLDLNGNLQIYRFARVPFGVISSPFLLGATVAHHLKKKENPIAEKIRKNIHVDNVITGTRTVVEAYDFYVAAKNIFQDASMNLCEWMSNSTEFLSFIPDNDRGHGQNIKVLGKLSFTYDQLFIILTESEAVLNSRPLIFVGEDIDFGFALTQGDFLSLNPKTGTPELQVDDIDPDYLPHVSTAQRLLDK